MESEEDVLERAARGKKPTPELDREIFDARSGLVLVANEIRQALAASAPNAPTPAIHKGLSERADHAQAKAREVLRRVPP